MTVSFQILPKSKDASLDPEKKLEEIYVALSQKEYATAANLVKMGFDEGMSFSEIKSYNELMNQFIQLGITETADLILDRLMKKFKPDVYTLNFALSGFAEKRDVKGAFEFFNQAFHKHNVVPNIYVFETLMRVCEQACDVKSAERAFAYLPIFKIQPSEKMVKSYKRLVNATQRIIHIQKGIKKPGDFLVVQPTPEAWKQVERIQQFVTAAFKQDGIKQKKDGGTWTPTPHRLSHITLFKDFGSPLTHSEQRLVMSKVAEKVSNLHALDFEVRVNDSETSIARGPGTWVTLHFTGPNLTFLKNKVIEAVKEAREEAKTRRKEEDEKGKGKGMDCSDPNEYATLLAITDDELGKTTVNPHLTLGILDVGPQVNHPDVTRLRKGCNVEEFGRLFELYKAGPLKDISFKIPLRFVSLLHCEDLYAPVEKKQYQVLRQLELIPRVVPSVKKESPEDKYKSCFYKMGSKLTSSFGFTGKLQLEDHAASSMSTRTIDLTFEETDAKTFMLLSEFLKATVETVDSKIYLHLREEHCKKLFGDKEGKEIYETLSQPYPGSE